MSGTYQVKRVTPDELRIELYGTFDAASASALERDVGRVLETLEAGSFYVLIDLLGLIDCAMDARPPLVSLQRRLAGCARRTAYYDDRPRFRGLALWVMHLAEDENAKAVSSMEQALRWVGMSTHRLEDMQQRAEPAGEVSP